MLTAVVILQPVGTLAAVLLVLVPLLATARRKVSPAIPAGGTLAIAAIVMVVDPSPRNILFTPLIGCAALFLLAAADIFWSAHQVNGLSRQTSAGPECMPGKVFYDKNGFVGSGIASSAFPLTVPLDKAKDETEPVHDVTAAELLAYIAAHLAAQGVSDGRPHGYAHDPAAATSLPPESAVAGNGASPRHFTYGLPYLQVGNVVAKPVPPPRKVPFTRIHRLRLNYAADAEDTAKADENRTADRSPSDFPDRNYVCAITASWDGQLVVSVFVSAALQGHFLQVVIRPYLITPIGADLKAADSLAGRTPVVLALYSLAMTARQFLRTAERVAGIARRAGGGSAPRNANAEPVKPGPLSARELYAQPVPDNIYHSEDAARLITVMEEKAIRATMRYLGLCNVDVKQAEAQIMNTFVQNTINGAGNIVVDSTVSQSTMTATSGQGNAPANGSDGS